MFAMIRSVRSSSSRLLDVLNPQRGRTFAPRYEAAFDNGRTRFDNGGNGTIDALSHNFILSKRKISSSAYRGASVFSGWKSNNDWHHPDFLSDTTLKEKEAWLEAMLAAEWKAVDVEAYIFVLNALADAEIEDAGAPRRAERWMKRLKDHHTLYPTAECYQHVIQAWANSSKEQVVVIVNRAERWLNDLIAESKAHPERIQPTIECFNAFLDACTRGRSGSNKRNQHIVHQNAQKADALLRHLHSHHHHMGDHTHPIPNTDTFNFVLRGWTRCIRDDFGATKVLSLLRLMESYQRSNPLNPEVRPDTKSYTMAMQALVGVAKIKARRCAKGRVFNEDISKNGISELKEAEAILNYMHELHNAGVEGVVPSTVPYNVLITGWASLANFKHNNSPFTAEEILRTMLSHKDKGLVEASPDRLSFEKVMLAWANSGHPNAGRRCSWWLRKLWNDSELYGNENLLPVTQTYNIAMKALAASEGALAAENLLLDLGDKYKEEGLSKLCPNSESFAIVIRAWLRNADVDPDIDERVQALKRAVEWLSSLQEVENENKLSTSPELYMGVLRVARKCARRRPDILELAKGVFEDFKDSRYQMNHESYAFLLSVGLDALWGSDDKETREEFVRNLFRDCCEDGLMSNLFARTLANSPVSATVWTAHDLDAMLRDLFHNWPLPTSWSRNLPHRGWQVKRIDIERQQSKHM